MIRASMRVAGIAGLVAAALLFAPPPAGAATYTVESCANGSISGWAPFAHGLWSGFGSSCGVAGGGLKAEISSATGATAGWRFSAPADTDIAGFRLTRAYSLPANQAFGTGVVTTTTEGSGNDFYDWEANYGAALSIGPQVLSAANLTGQSSLTATVGCGGGSQCTGGAKLTIYGAAFDLRDGFGPRVANISGSLLAPGPLKATRAVSISATDRGGGIRHEQLLVDGQPTGDRWLDCDYSLVVPCPLSDSHTFTVDTTRLAEGDHELQLVVADATLANSTRYGPFGIAVDNVPPPAATAIPRIRGDAVRGQTLYADDGTWSGGNLSFSRRWQRYEDGAWQDIRGAQDPVYVPGDEDGGHRLRFRVRATNTEGATDAFSEATARVPLPETPTPTPSPPTIVVAAPPPSPVIVTSAPAASGARVAAAFQATGRATITLPYGRRPKIRGTFVQADGRPIAAAQLVVTSRLRMLDAQPLRVGHVVTDSAGRFTYTPTAGASRTLAFGYANASARVTLRVVPHVTLRITRAGRIAGHVSGAPAGLRPTIDLQAPHGHVWRTYATTRLRPTGGTFTYHAGRPPHRVRALIRTDPSWPFATGTSAAATRRR